MKRIGIIFAFFALMAFTTSEVEKNEITTKESTLKVHKSISEFQKIIIKKQQKAKGLQLKAMELSVSNIQESNKMIEQSNLLKMNCLKYEAAIACLQRHLE